MPQTVYIGLTTTQLNTRINHHRSNILNHKRIYLCVHFNFPDHSLEDLSVQAIDTVPDNCLNSLQELKKLETYWIQVLKTLQPLGLNVSKGTYSHNKIDYMYTNLTLGVSYMYVYKSLFKVTLYLARMKMISYICLSLVQGSPGPGIWTSGWFTSYIRLLYMAEGWLLFARPCLVITPNVDHVLSTHAHASEHNGNDRQYIC